MTHGYLEAIKLAREKSVPIETFFVTGALPRGQFQVHLCDTAERVYVFLFLPEQEDHAGGSTNAEARSWVVRAGGAERDDAEGLADRVEKVVTSPGKS